MTNINSLSDYDREHYFVTEYKTDLATIIVKISKNSDFILFEQIMHSNRMRLDELKTAFTKFKHTVKGWLKEFRKYPISVKNVHPDIISKSWDLVLSFQLMHDPANHKF